jgi:uncharacterized protein
LAEKVKQLRAQGYVNDFAGTLSEQTRQQLTALCTEVEQKTHAQIAVVTIHTLEGLEAADFANRLFQQWGVGHKDDNRGVLILLAVADHKYWIEVGYGLEPILPDGKVGGFGREMVPRLRAGDYNGGVLHLASEIADVIARDRGVALGTMPVSPPQASKPAGRGPGSATASVIALLFLVFFAMIFLGIPALVIYFIIRVVRATTAPRPAGPSGSPAVPWSVAGSGSRSSASSSAGGGFTAFAGESRTSQPGAAVPALPKPRTIPRAVPKWVYVAIAIPLILLAVTVVVQVRMLLVGVSASTVIIVVALLLLLGFFGSGGGIVGFRGGGFGGGGGGGGFGGFGGGSSGGGGAGGSW